MDVPVVGNALPRRGNRLSRLIARSLMTIFGWRIEVDAPDLPKLVLVGAPHTSNWDFVLTLTTFFALSVRISWMAKHTLFRWPVKGLLEWLGGVPIDRTIPADGVVNQTVEAFNSRDKFVIAIMPEGTRTKARRWRTGFYHIAQGAKVPIVLVRFDYGRKVMGIGPTIEPSGDIAADMAQIQSVFTSIRGKNPLQGVSKSGESEVGP
ncbi:MAG: lysophospholipid acyltransferase family protein [Anaerolineaceae bacterium]|nr:MAG: lysophospholipid acyltransferase family protein [Anaerolineaceae bacterium]